MAIAYHGTRHVERVLREGLRQCPPWSHACPFGGHVSLTDKPHIAANFGTVLEVEVDDTLVFTGGEARWHGRIPADKIRVLESQPPKSWDGFVDPALTTNHPACLNHLHGFDGMRFVC